MALPAHLEPLRTFDPKFYSLLDELKEISFGQGVLDSRTKFLIGLAINLCLERKEKVACALDQAKAAGATEQEVQEVLRLTYFIKGISTAMSMAESVKPAAGKS